MHAKILFPLTICILNLPCNLSAAPDVSGLRAGAAASDISPIEFPVNMPGGFSANMAQSCHDPLYARSIVLNRGAIAFSLSVVDSLGAGPEVLDEAKRIASERTGIPTNRMLVCSTHTHSAPSSGPKSNPAQTQGYRKIFVDGLADSITRAHGALQPALVGAAVRPLPDEVFNRRWFLKPGRMAPNPFGKMDQVKMNPPNSSETLDRPAGPTDPDITVLSVQTHKRQPLGLFANYSLHYVGGMPPAQVSADYFGEFARLMPSRLNASSSFVAMMSNGASGDINNIPFGSSRPPREPFEQIRIVAQKAADTAWRAVQDIGQHQSTPGLAMLEKELTLRFRRPTPEQLEEAKALLAIKDKEAIERLPRLAQNYARNTIASYERPEETLTIKLQAIRIGDLAICGIPFETFVEIGLQLKRESPFPKTMVVGLANGRHGYLPTPEHHSLGGYETWLGTNVVEENASVMITNTLLEMLGELSR
jgi:neutral ceramidase